MMEALEPGKADVEQAVIHWVVLVPNRYIRPLLLVRLTALKWSDP
jgi:hypothetical protein